MKNIALALAALAVIAGSSVRAQTVETAPAAQAGVEAAPAGQKQVLDMPPYAFRLWTVRLRYACRLDEAQKLRRRAGV
jgi:hypothetical protein